MEDFQIIIIIEIIMFKFNRYLVIMWFQYNTSNREFYNIRGRLISE